MDPLVKIRESIETIENQLDYVFHDKDLLITAFIHSSFINENRKWVLEHNERLEFLGDSVLGIYVADYLFRSLPEKREGILSQLRSFLVNTPACAQYMKRLQMESLILMGKGEKLAGGHEKESLLADAFEAIVGAIYLDGGIGEAFLFLKRTVEDEIKKGIASPVRNFKAELQEYCQKHFQKHPIYEILKEVGPAHDKIFFVAVRLENEEIGRGEGRSKKEAETAAAEVALQKFLNS